jgi:type I site-specific restriction endonuclease
MSAPEARARQLIDGQLEAAGWILQHRDEFNRKAARGVAVREFPLPAGEADYLLFIDGRAAGVIEAKKAGTTLSGFAEQSDRYLVQLPEHLDAWADPLLFGYESTGIETLFRDLRDQPADGHPERGRAAPVLLRLALQPALGAQPVRPRAAGLLAERGADQRQSRAHSPPMGTRRISGQAHRGRPSGVRDAAAHLRPSSVRRS